MLELLVWQTGVHRRELSECRPIEPGAAALDQCEETVMHQACQRHRHPECLGRSEEEPNVLFSQRRGESRRLESLTGDQLAAIAKQRTCEKRGGQNLEVAVPVNTWWPS